MGKGDVQIVDIEHAMKRFDEELDEEVGRQQASEAYIVGRVRMLEDWLIRFSSSRQGAQGEGVVAVIQSKRL